MSSTPSSISATSPEAKFGRALQPNELSEYQKTIEDTLSLLGKKNLAMIIHGASFPSEPGEDTGIGSPNSKGAKRLFNFLKTMGFNSVQLGPGGKTKAIDASPYTSTSFSNNPLFVDLAMLANDPKWAGILSTQTLDDIVRNTPQQPPHAGKPRTAYGYIYRAQERALRESFQTYQQKRQNLQRLPQTDVDALNKLERDFQAFRLKNQAWLERDSLYEALSIHHQNDYWPIWPSELDKRLYSPSNAQEEQATQARIQEIKTQHADDIAFYEFCQFIAFAQKEEMKAFARQTGMNLIADRQVAFSDRDVWAYQALFLDGYKLGAPPDYFSQDGQAWGFPVLDPAKLFQPDGSLGPAGELLKTLFEKIFLENPGGVRIDHIIGLIDPWVYRAGQSPRPESGAGRLFSSPEHPDLHPFSKIDPSNLNHAVGPDDERRVQHLTPEQVQRYGDLLNIVIAAAQAQGLDKDAIICEDLGTLTNPVKAVLEQLDLSGVRVTQFVDPQKPDHLYRGKNVPAKHWVMAGTHDNEPLRNWIDRLWQNGQAQTHAQYLAEDLEPDVNARGNFIQSLLQDSHRFLVAKLAELFASPSQHVQIFFPDFFGIRETYNKPGTGGDQNWSLRLSNTFEQDYFEKLTRNEALNLPEVLLTALKAKRPDVLQHHPDLVRKLEHYRHTLKNTPSVTP